MNRLVIDDIGVEIIAMHYGIVWGETKSIPTRMMGNLVGINTLCLSPHPIP